MDGAPKEGPQEKVAKKRSGKKKSKFHKAMEQQGKAPSTSLELIKGSTEMKSEELEGMRPSPAPRESIKEVERGLVVLPAEPGARTKVAAKLKGAGQREGGEWRENSWGVGHFLCIAMLLAVVVVAIVGFVVGASSMASNSSSAGPSKYNTFIMSQSWL